MTKVFVKGTVIFCSVLLSTDRQYVMKELRITLVQDRPNEPFYSGSSVTGSLVVVVDEPKRYQDISIQFFGRAKVQWTELGSSSSGRGIAARYWSKQIYVDAIRNLWTADQSPNGCLPPGQHIYPFCFKIPRNAPSSFEGTVGSIRYELRGRIGKGFLKFDHKIQRSVPVQQVVDMSDPRLLEPIRQEVQKTVCVLCCALAPIVLTVTLPKQGYRIEETLPLHVTIENGSSRRITLKASLNQSVRYTAASGMRTSGKIILLIRSDEIAPHVTSNWDPAPKIPATAAIDQRSCANITISYSLKITAIIPWEYDDLYTEIPLKLGYVHEQPRGEITLPPQPLFLAKAPPNPRDNT